MCPDKHWLLAFGKAVVQEAKNTDMLHWFGVVSTLALILFLVYSTEVAALVWVSGVIGGFASIAHEAGEAIKRKAN